MERIYRRTFPQQKRKIYKNIERTEIVKSKVISALAKLNRNKETVPEGIEIEMLTASDDFGIDKNYRNNK